MEISDAFRAYNAPLIVEGSDHSTQARWEGIQAWSETATAAEVPDLVEGMYGTALGPASLWASLQAKDETLVPSAGTPAARLLSAAALDYLFTTKWGLDVPAALAVATAAFGGRELAAVPVDIVARAEAELNSISDERRARSDLKDAIAKIRPEAIGSKFATELPADFSAAKTVAAFAELSKSVLKSLEKIASETRAALTALQTHNHRTAEESEVLWFVFAGISKSGGKRFADLNPQEAVILAAFDLADLTDAPLHTDTFNALLTRLNVPESNYSVKSYIEKIPTDLIAARIKRDPNARLFPLHKLLDRYREFGSTGSTWAKGADDHIGFAPSLKIDGYKIALQFYRELILSKELP